MYEEVRTLDLRLVLSAFGFTDFKERKGGTEFFGVCPVHKGENKSCFSFDTSGRFNCFACSTKGRGAIDLVKAIKGCGFQEAINLLKSLQPGTPTPRQEPTPTIQQPTENAPYKSSYSKYFVPSTWLQARGLEQTTLDYYGVGEYSNPSRKSAYTGHILFPVKRFKDGETVGYLARNPNPQPDAPKYRFPKGVSKGLELFGGWQLHQILQLPQVRAVLKVLFVVESPLTVMKFHQMGFPAVSPYGWSVSEQQIDILASLARGLIYLPDRNKYEEAVLQVARLGRVCWVKYPELPAGIDDPEHLEEEWLQSQR